MIVVGVVHLETLLSEQDSGAAKTADTSAGTVSMRHTDSGGLGLKNLGLAIAPRPTDAEDTGKHSTSSSYTILWLGSRRGNGTSKVG